MVRSSRVGLWDGATENKTVVKAMLADLVSRGLSAEDGLLVVMDGAKALSAAVNEVFGDSQLSKDAPCTSGEMLEITCQIGRRSGSTRSS